MNENTAWRGSMIVDPPSRDYYEDRLFDIANSHLNRDGTLLPFSRLREHVLNRGIHLHTADYLFQGKIQGAARYYSLGILSNFKEIRFKKTGNLSAFVIMEPPVVAPKLYKALPSLTAAFDHVYVHNTHGDGYSLDGVDVGKLRKLYWPVPYNNVLEPFWSIKNRQHRIVVINGNHNPRFRAKELYSTRIEAMASLAKLDAVDLFGRGWNEWWSPKSMWPPYWMNRKMLMSIYRGACSSKFEVLSRYKFCLCFENMAMDGYITEKIFDCLYAGTIPLYLGAPDISQIIPDNAYVDCRKFSSWNQMWEEICNMPESQIESMKQAGLDFLASKNGLCFYNSLNDIFEID